MRLILMRHADAVDSAGNDSSRTLSDHGWEQARAMGDWLQALGVPIGRAVSSPYPRALETAERVAECQTAPVSVIIEERLAPGMTRETGSALIHEFGVEEESCLLMVGHAPDMDKLAAHLIGAAEGGIAMKKGAAAMLDTVHAGFGGSTLHWLINPGIRAV